MSPFDVEVIVQQSVERFKASLGWKTNFIDQSDVDNYKAEIRRVIQDAYKAYAERIATGAPFKS